MKPAWWPSWLPPACANDHELAPGRINLSWVSCACPGAGDGDSGHPTGHHVVTCRVLGCEAELYPPEHVTR